MGLSMENINGFWADYSGPVLNFLIALLFLLAFYIGARIVRSIIGKVMEKTDIDNRFIKTVGLKEDFPAKAVLAGVGFWIIMFYGILLFFDKLRLETVAQPINTFLTEIFAYLPKLGAAIGLLILAWVLASGLKMAIVKAAEMFNLDKRLDDFDEEGKDHSSVAGSLANAGYWFVFLLFLPMVLGTLGMESLVTPLQDMFSELFTYLPNIFAAALIFIIGCFVARIVRQIVSSLLVATGADKLSEKAGMTQTVSGVVGAVLYTVILLLVIVQALDALKIEAISAPAQHMIDIIFMAVPGLLSAIFVLVISYYVGKLISGLVTDLLTASGFDGLVAKTGLRAEMPKTPSQYVGSLVLFGVILFAILGATELVGFEPLSNIVSILIGFAIQVVLGAIILGIGILIANKVNSLIADAGGSPVVGNLSRISILVLATAMALRQLGLAEDIINMAFGIILGALGIGAAIAIGLGSKDIAGREVERVIENFRK